ncbi:606_t:CDS:2, partial [Racocetra fulgida]
HKVNKPGDVKMNAISSGTNNAMNKAIPTMIIETRAGKAKRKAVSDMVSNEDVNLDSNVGSIVTCNDEIEVSSSNGPTSTKTTINYESPGATTTVESLGATTTIESPEATIVESPGATTIESPGRNVLGEIEP